MLAYKLVMKVAVKFVCVEGEEKRDKALSHSARHSVVQDVQPQLKGYTVVSSTCHLMVHFHHD